MFKSSVDTKQRRELLFEVHEKVADIGTQIANEPSEGLYYVQQHVQKAVPALVDAKKQVAQGRDTTNFVKEDLTAATATIQNMKACGPATFEQMRKDMEKAYLALPALKAMRGLGVSVRSTPRATPSSSPKKGSSPWKSFGSGSSASKGASSSGTASSDLGKVAQSLTEIQAKGRDVG